MSGSRSSVRPLTGRKVLVMIVGFFGVIFAVNGVMMKLAIQTLPGTEVDSAYSASLAYENEIAAAHDQDARGWKVDAHVQRRMGADAELRVEVHDRSGLPVTGLRFQGRFERPADRRADQAVDLVATGDGIYFGKAASILSGQWDLVLEGETGGQRLFLSKNRILLD
jgi:nitrogen fixation protein FixH